MGRVLFLGGVVSESEIQALTKSGKLTPALKEAMQGDSDRSVLLKALVSIGETLGVLKEGMSDLRANQLAGDLIKQQILAQVAATNGRLNNLEDWKKERDVALAVYKKEKSDEAQKQKEDAIYRSGRLWPLLLLRKNIAYLATILVAAIVAAGSIKDFLGVIAGMIQQWFGHH
jgi:hypothetical protein